jgi:hypothetical protein
MILNPQLEGINKKKLTLLLVWRDNSKFDVRSVKFYDLTLSSNIPLNIYLSRNF